ncbi:MAG: acetolactate synthase [Pirellulaceae bacterium]|nr:MAG: acetolactate synthase [Pirellulaceae bacterium]
MPSPVRALPPLIIPKATKTMSTGESSSTNYQTARGRDYPSIRQFTVFLENRVGQLLEVVRRFEGTGIRIVALSISDSAECAFVRFLVSHPERGREILERAGLALIESDLIALELPEDGQPLLQVCSALLQAEINIVQAYPLLTESGRAPAVAIMVDNTDLAAEVLSQRGFRLLNEDDLLNR